MKTAFAILTVIVLSLLSGCAEGEKDGDLHMTVNFQKGKTLRYKFESTKDIAMNWDPRPKTAKTGKKTVTKSSESMKMVVAYTPIEADPYGETIIKAKCESVTVSRINRKKQTKSDAVKSFKGKTFQFTIDAAGRIKDYSDIERVIKEVGSKAFRPSKGKSRIKDPDMVRDLIASQRFLFDSISSIEDPIKGVSVGQSWNSKIIIPNPMLQHKAANVTYTLNEIRENDAGQFAVIASSFSPSDSVPKGWPVPYTGRFKISGTFGFLAKFITNYKVLDLNGKGEELFDIDKGILEKSIREYTVIFEAGGISPLGAKPQVTIDQKMTMELIKK